MNNNPQTFASIFENLNTYSATIQYRVMADAQNIINEDNSSISSGDESDYVLAEGFAQTEDDESSTSGSYTDASAEFAAECVDTVDASKGDAKPIDDSRDLKTGQKSAWCVIC